MDQMFWRVARRHRRGQKGFTLIELLVVVAVLAILAAIVLFNVTGVTNRGKSSACSTDVKSVQTAVDSYVSDNGAYGTGTVPNNTVVTNLLSAGSISSSFGLVPNYLHSATVSCTTLTIVDANGTTGGGTRTNGSSPSVDNTNGYTVAGS